MLNILQRSLQLPQSHHDKTRWTLVPHPTVWGSCMQLTSNPEGYWQAMNSGTVQGRKTIARLLVWSSSPPLLSLSHIPLPIIQLGAPQWGPGQSPSCKRILGIFWDQKKDLEVETMYVFIPLVGTKLQCGVKNWCIECTDMLNSIVLKKI